MYVPISNVYAVKRHYFLLIKQLRGLGFGYKENFEGDSSKIARILVRED
jgi:hypothetical protein